jgi:uncharacterized membrane protein SpoIIM required for sporulation
MAAMLSGVIMIAAFSVVAAAGLLLAVTLYRIGGRRAAGSDAESGQADAEGG